MLHFAKLELNSALKSRSKVHVTSVLLTILLRIYEICNKELFVPIRYRLLPRPCVTKHEMPCSYSKIEAWRIQCTKTISLTPSSKRCKILAWQANISQPTFKFSHFTEFVVPLPYSEALATGPYHKGDDNSHTHTLPLEIIRCYSSTYFMILQGIAWLLILQPKRHNLSLWLLIIAWLSL